MKKPGPTRKLIFRPVPTLEPSSWKFFYALNEVKWVYMGSVHACAVPKRSTKNYTNIIKEYRITVNLTYLCYNICYKEAVEKALAWPPLS